jgi:hypothetical protein
MKIPQTCSNCIHFRSHEKYKCQTQGEPTKQMFEIWKQLGICTKEHKPKETNFALSCIDYTVKSNPCSHPLIAQYNYYKPEFFP